MVNKKVKKIIKKSLPKTVPIEKVSPLKKTKIKVVGVGGGGGNIVSELAQRVKKASFLAANTDLQALREISRKVERFPFGQSATGGLGTGLNPEIAEAASQNEKERIKKILKDQNLVIFIACLGGGTGSGATPVFAKISQSLGNLNYGIFTLPFKFEGEKKMEIAKAALKSLRPKLNALTVLPNERIFQLIDKTTPLKEAFSVINKNLAQSLEGLIETIYQPGLINIDFADLKTILGGRGRLAYLNTLSLPREEGAAREMAEKVLTSPLYPYGIKGGKGVLFNIAGQKELSLAEVSQISQTISEKVNSEAKIIFGIQPFFSGRGLRYQNIIKTTIFVTGLSITPQQKFYWEVESKGRKKISKAKTKPREEEKSLFKLEEETRLSPKVKKEKLKKSEKKLPASDQRQLREEIRKVQPPPKVESEKENLPASEEKVETPLGQVKIRKNALQLKKEIEEEEKKIIEKEKFWESPAFLRKKLNN